MQQKKQKKLKVDHVPSPTEAILESISDGVFTIDLNWHITSFNRAAEDITGMSRAKAIGNDCCDVFRSSMCESECALRHTMKNGKSIIGRTGYIIQADGHRIPISVSTAVLRDNRGKIVGGAETFRDLRELEALQEELQGRFHVGDMVSRSPIMQRIFEVLPAIASSPSTVLILGDTGTGKELLARTIHTLSSRGDGPFVAVNCSALPDALLESELFGYKTGAFTGAVRDKAGRFTMARGGTLFLDEIGDVSPALQMKLLRVLQDRVFEPLGATRSETADVRIIAATNRDLAERMRQSQFREDLYYRINIVRVELPPLRRRKEDIPLLVREFIDHFNRLQKKNIRGADPEALALLMAYDWPGNVRELENVIERAFILCHQGRIALAHLPTELRMHTEPEAAESDIRSAHAMLDKQAIQDALRRNHFNRQATADELGVHKTTLFRKMKKLSIIFPDKNGRSSRRRR
jgi:PAS domain S-box-containing protein